MTLITCNDFEKVEIRVGKIVKVQEFPKTKKPAYKLWVDFGKLGIEKSSAGITKLYTKDELVGQMIIAVTNLTCRKVADFMSEVLVLGVLQDNNEVVLIQPQRDVQLGKRIL